MRSVELRRAISVILQKLLSSKLLRYPLQALLFLWLFFKRRTFGLENSRRTRGGRKPGGNAGVVHPSPEPRLSWKNELGDCTRRKDTQGDSPEPRLRWEDEKMENSVICTSQVPHSALGLHLGPYEGASRLLQPTDIPSRPVSVHADDFLHPYSWGRHDNASKSSQDIGLASLNDHAQDNLTQDNHDRLSYRSNVSHSRTGQLRASSRATSRLSRVASRAHSRASHSTRMPSRSRSGAPSPSPQPSMDELAPEYSPASPSSRHIAVPTISSVPPPSFQSQEFTPKPRRIIYPIMEAQRYDRDIIMDKLELQCVIPPMTMSFPLEHTPAEWIPCTHPEGALYFYHPARRIYTDANLCNPVVLAEILEFAHLIDDLVREDDIELPHDARLVLDLQDDPDGGNLWCYYFASDSQRTLFWLSEYDATDILQQEVKGVKSFAHIKHEIEGRYWQHMEQFPYDHELPEDALKQLGSIIVQLTIDQMTSTTSTGTYSAKELQDMMGSISNIRDLGPNDYTVSVLGRLMYIFAHFRFLHFHGQYGARLCRDQSIYGEPPSSTGRTPLITILSPLFFNAPDVHLRALEQLWIDGLINQLLWGQFINKLQIDWQEFVLYATVMLNANVAFLTIPDVDPSPGQRTMAKLISFISIITSVGSIILGLLLVRHHRVKPRDTAQDVVEYLTRKRHPTLGLETLAILYSLPYALLMWAILAFLLAFAFECFRNYDVASYATATFWAVTGLLILWCIYTLWDSESGESVWSTLRGAVDNMFTSIQRKLFSAPKLLIETISGRQYPPLPGNITPRLRTLDHIEP